MPPGGAEVSQLIKLETQRPKKGANNLVMSMNYLIGHINELPERSGELEADILHNATIQAESGAYTREISQNSKDIVSRGEMRDVEVDVEYYLQKNESGQKEYVEEARDNGTGALQEIALLIPKSTKAGGRQKSWGGFFGTGKYTIFEDADRLEIITKNKESAWLFNFDVTRNDSGAPVEIRLTRIQKINDPRLKQGVTIRRVKLAKNTIPMLDQMLSERAWKIFAGLSQDGHFKIFFIDYKGARKQLFVEKEELSRVEFKAVRRGERGVTDFGTLSIIRTKDMPLQVLDKEGRRVKELNDECLALIPQDLRKHVKELGINIRIPLPLIHTRSAFEYEDEYMPIIQRYIAIAFYKAIAYKTMKQPEAGKPQFIFEGFPADWETDETYWASLVPGFDLLASLGITKDFWKYTTGRLDERLARLVTHINQGEYEKVRNQDLEALLSQENKKLFIQLVILLNSGDTSLLDRRVALQIRATQEREGARGDMLFDIGGIPFAREKLDRISIKATLYKQAERLEDFIIDPVEYTTREKGFVEMALGIARNIGFSNIVLMDEKLVVPGAFREGTIYLRRTVARLLGESDLSRGVIDSATDTIIHELAHYLEDIARLNGNGGAEDNKGIYNIPEDFYTHTARGGIFDKAMRYIAWLSLANYESEEQGIAPDSSPINLTVGARHDL
ncbi:MAG: hypothetical protein Q8O12_02765 [Candidatus Omnitrophota bacterium]|nr:hypothetical protein [Candidatus Omnitrophota bacterium]